MTFNNSETIAKIINNILNLFINRITFKIYIIDNGSSDKTVNICKSLSRKFSQIEVIENKHNVGFGAGHNCVLNLLDSQYHIVLNPDIKISSFSEIKKMIQFMDDNQTVGLLSPLVLNEDGSIQYLYKLKPTVLDLAIRFISPKLMPNKQAKFVRKDSGYQEIGDIEYASGCFMLFRTSIFREISGFDEKYFMYMEDADITQKVNEISKAKFFPKAFVTHAWQRASHKQLKYVLITLKSMWIYFNKWGWKFY